MSVENHSDVGGHSHYGWHHPLGTELKKRLPAHKKQTGSMAALSSLFLIVAAG